MVGFKATGRTAARRLTSSAAVRRLLRSASLAGLVPRPVWSRLPVETTFRVSSSDRVHFRYVSVAADNIGRALFWRGLRAWEAESVAAFVPLARRARTFLDIGANTGAYTLIACAENDGLRAVCFEPVPHIHERLCDNIALNRLEARCTPRAAAVSDTEGRAKLHVPHGMLPTSASLDQDGFRGWDGTLIDVPVTTIDAACRNIADVDLVKIDVEGFEDRVLSGMSDVLSRCAPAIIVECNPDGPCRAVEGILRRHGYRFFHLQRRGPSPRATIEPDPSEEFRNYLCLPNLKLDWISNSAAAEG